MELDGSQESDRQTLRDYSNGSLQMDMQPTESMHWKQTGIVYRSKKTKTKQNQRYQFSTENGVDTRQT